MISGVSILLGFNGRTKPIAVDGHVGQLKEGVAEIWAKVDLRYTSITWGVNVDGQKNVVLKKNRAEADEDGAVYVCRIPIKVGLTGTLHTEYPGNHLRLIRLDGRKVQIWEIALVSQNGEFFVTEQMTYMVNCYRDNGKLTCPQFQKWPQMIELLNKLLADKMDRFSPISEYQPEDEVTADVLEKGQGWVLWWNCAQGLGAIITPDGALRVHWSEVAKRPRLAYLVAGEIVRYDGIRLPVQTKARFTSFGKEAVGVSPSR